MSQKRHLRGLQHTSHFVLASMWKGDALVLSRLKYTTWTNDDAFSYVDIGLQVSMNQTSVVIYNFEDNNESIPKCNIFYLVACKGHMIDCAVQYCMCMIFYNIRLLRIHKKFREFPSTLDSINQAGKWSQFSVRAPYVFVQVYVCSLHNHCLRLRNLIHKTTQELLFENTEITCSKLLLTLLRLKLCREN